MSWHGPIDASNLAAPSTMPHPWRHWIDSNLNDGMLFRPCVDCGLMTGCFCDWCFAAERSPKEVWAERQKTPLCTKCDTKFKCCHYCKGLHWCTPQARIKDDDDDDVTPDGVMSMAK